MEQEEPDTISDAGLEPGEFLAIHIGGSFNNSRINDDTIRTKTSEFWFFQVADRASLRYQPFELRDEQGSTVGSIGTTSGVQYQRFFDSNGDDILRNEDNSWRVYHFSVGVEESNIRIYPRVPDNQNGGAWGWLGGSDPDPTAGDLYGYIPSDEIDADDPPIELESVAWRNDTRSVHQYGFYNADTANAQTPTLTVQGHAYELRPVYDEDDMLHLLADLERPSGKQQNAIRRIDFSRAALRTFSYDVPDAWRDTENNLQVSKANLPLEIEGAVQQPPEEGAEGVERRKL